MSYTLRMPQEADYSALTSWIANADQCARWAGAKLRFPFTVEALPDLLRTETCDTFALIDTGLNLAGFGQILHRESGTGHLGRIIVNPGRRQQGLGRILCQQLIDFARSRYDYRSMTLWVYRDNPAALRLYESLGFVPEHREGYPECQFMRLNIV